jgi:glycosyltransferase involved in cell wall biosynthesis
MPRDFSPRVVYLGFNDPREHIRGTENVIQMQANAAPGRKYYVFRAASISVFRWQRIVAIGCPHNLLLASVFIRHLIKRITRRAGQSPIIHGHSYLLTAIASGAPIVFTVHDGLTYLKRCFGSRVVWPYRWIERLVYRRATRIHAISKYAWSQAVAGRAAQGKVSYIYNSLPHPVGASADASGSAGIPRAETEYLVVRSIEDRANLELIVEFARHCQREQPEAKILVAGKGPLLRYYRSLVETERLSNLDFLGYVPDETLAALYRRAACVLMPAKYGEGFGLPLIEAYARGVPAVGSRVCAVPEVIHSAPLMFDNELDSLCDAIAAARRIPRQDFVTHFDSHFSVAEIQSQYRAFYNAVV